MKFVNLDESEIIEQPLEKVIARPDYSPIEFGYDNLCSLDSVSVDGIHPSGGDSDLILPPSVNKINSCFKSEYFKISNLFSEIQTYEQKQQALKNLGILDTINNSTYIHDLGTDLQPHIATGNIITYVKDNNIKETVLFKYIDTDGSSTLGVCISRINDIGWIIYLVARKGIERLVFNSNGVREECNEYGGVLRHNLDSVADEQLECLSVKGVKSLLSTKLDALSPGDGITMMNNTVSTLIGNGLTYNGREIVIDHDLTLKTNNGKLGVNAGDGLYVNPDNELGINIGKGLAINHTDSTVEVAEEVFEELDSKAPLEGYAPNLKVRFSDGLVGRIETIPREIGRISPTAGISVDDNSATIERIKGESVVWNQLLSENKFRVSMATLEDDGNYYKVIPTDASANRFQQRRNVIKDHVYLQTAIVYNTSNVYIKFCNYLGLTMISSSSQTNASEPTLIWEIKKATETIESYIQIGNLFTLDPYWVKKNSFFLYDLTLMFGAGNEPTTIEEFEARKPLGVTNDYNEGTIVSFQGGDVKSVGFNAWDEEVHLGHYVDKTGLHANVKDRLCSKNPIKIIPNSTYYKNIKEFGVFYDSNMNYIGNHNSVNIFTTPPNAAYYQFNIPKEYGTTYKNDICIHLVHSGYRNGEYEPYVEDIHPLPDIKSIKDSNGDTLFPYGLLSAGNVHDEITATKAVKRIGVVDMGSLTWNNTEIGEFVLKFANIFTAVKRDRFAVLTNKYVTVDKNYTALLNGEIMSYIAPTDTIVYSRIGIRDDFYTDNATFKQAMNGVLLYYELAEPIEVDLQEPLNMTYEAWDFGTEELVVNEPSTSLKGEIIYHFNAVDRIRDNSRNITTETERAKLAEKTNSDAIAVEKARAEAKELELTNTITDETNTRIAADKTITDTIGEVETGKTLVEMIKAAEATAIAAATVVAEDSEFITIEQTGEVGKTQTYIIKTQDIASIGDLAAEISRAQEAEQGNSDAINSIKSDYLKSSDKLELSQAIVSETEARVLAISNLEFKNSLKLDGVVLSEELLTTLSDVQSGALYSVGPDSNDQYKLYAYVNSSWTYMGYLNSSSIDITQSLGLSLNLAISQKAVTDALTPIIMTLAEFDALVSNGTITDDDLTIRYIID